MIDSVCNKIYRAASGLRRLRNFLPIPTKISLVQSLLLPILDYADISYPDLNDEHLRKLERMQNYCIRFIFGLRKFDHVSQFRRDLKWLTIRDRRNFHLLSLLYNVLFYPLSPNYLKNRFTFLSNTHDRNLRSSSNLILNIPLHSSTSYSNSFTIKSAKLWNALPLSVRIAPSITIFKKLLREHYLSL